MDIKLVIDLHCFFFEYYLYVSYPMESGINVSRNVYGLKASKKLPLSVSLIVDSLDRILLYS